MFTARNLKTKENNFSTFVFKLFFLSLFFILCLPTLTPVHAQESQINAQIISANSLAEDNETETDITIHSINVFVPENGSITPSGIVNVNEGSSETFSMIPYPGYRVSDVFIDGVSIGPMNEYVFGDIQTDHTISANFEPDTPKIIQTYAVTAIAQANGHIFPEGTVTVQEGSDQNFTIIPDKGYRIRSVWVNNSSVGTVNNYQFTNIKSDNTITAVFEPSVLDPRVFFERNAQSSVSINDSSSTDQSGSSGRSNQPPVANAGSDQIHLASVGESINVTLDGSASFDNDGTIIEYQWTGTPDPQNIVTPTVSLGIGTYNFSLVVKDNLEALSASDTVTIKIQPSCVTDSDCNDANICNGIETCQDGACSEGAALTCSDNNVCNGIETCDAINGCQTGTPLSCNDNLFCNGEESCDSLSGCQAGPAVCSGQMCNESTDSCVECLVDANCSDNNICTGIETCQSGVCVAGTALSCDDGNVCNGAESCDAINGCQTGISLNCDDSNTCTLDSCDAINGCSHSAMADGTSCVDNNVCNGTETCQSGTCTAGSTLNCDDNISCTMDACDALAGCSHTPNDAVCSDGNICTGIETCDVLNGCQSGTLLTCNDDLFCNGSETCDPIIGCQSGAAVCVGQICDEDNNVCANCLVDADCSDHNVCNGIETCQSGSCIAGTTLSCDDGISCTTDACDALTGCSHTANHSVCSDNNLCNGIETCDLINDCQAGSPLICDDNNVCNGIETCSAASGCITGTPLVCDDNNVCNGIETCHVINGCQTGTALNCADSIACTVDSCDALNGCTHTADNTICTDNIFCNGVETCNLISGCQAAAAAMCEGQQCDEVNQQCVECLTDLDCSDNNICNGTETCLSGACQSGSPLICPLGSTCDVDQQACIVHYTLTLTTQGNGSISKNPDLPSYAQDSSVVLRAIPEEGYYFVNWQDDLTGTNNPDTIIMNADKTVKAIFAPITYTITATHGDHGIMTPAGNITVNLGENQTFYITADDGYEIEDVLVDGSSLGTPNQHTFNNLSSNHTIHASFTVLADNHAPVVSVGDDLEVILPNSLSLTAFVEDDNLPSPPEITVVWSVVQKPFPSATVNFTDAHSLNTLASFSQEGDYILRLTASDGQLEGFDELLVTVHPDPTALPKCSDGIDNDNDGAVDDYDYSCLNAPAGSTPNENTPLSPCQDGIDNDNDGWIDMMDPGCATLQGESESATVYINNPQCSDGIDNDGDGFIDGHDPQCMNPADNDESTNPAVVLTGTDEDYLLTENDGFFVNILTKPAVGTTPESQTFKALVKKPDGTVDILRSMCIPPRSEKFYNKTGNDTSFLNITYEMIPKKGGLDIKYTLTNTSPTLSVEVPQFLISCLHQTMPTASKSLYRLEADDYGGLVKMSPTGVSWMEGEYPKIYAPVLLTVPDPKKTEGYAIGSAIMYRYVDKLDSFGNVIEAGYKHTTSARIQRSVSGVTANTWKYDYSDPNQEIKDSSGNFLNAVILPGEAPREYVVSLRFSKPRYWLLTLYPYKQYFNSLYSADRHLAPKDRRPVQGINIANTDAFNLREYNNDKGLHNPTGGGWNAFINSYLPYVQNLGYKRVLIWLPSGRYPTGLNFPPQFMDFLPWLTDPSQTGGSDPNAGGFGLDNDPLRYPLVDVSIAEFQRFEQAGIDLGFWAGRSGEVPQTFINWFDNQSNPPNAIDLWQGHSLKILDIHNPAHVAFWKRQFTLAKRRHAKAIGFDAFTYSKPSERYHWVDQIREFLENPDAPLIHEASGPDFMHVKMIQWQFPEHHYAIDGPNMIASYLNPGREDWLFYRQITYDTYSLNLENLQTLTRWGYTLALRQGGSNSPGETNVSSLDTTSVVACADGIDNDGDGKIDFPYDDGCWSARDESETTAPDTICNNGIDDDGDGAIDWPLDPGCDSIADNSE